MIQENCKLHLIYISNGYMCVCMYVFKQDIELIAEQIKLITADRLLGKSCSCPKGLIRDNSLQEM